MFTDKLSKMYHEAKIATIVAADTNSGFVQCYHDAVCYYLLWLDTNYNSTKESNHNLGKDLLAEKTLLADQRQRGLVNSPSDVRLTVWALSTGMLLS